MPEVRPFLSELQGEAAVSEVKGAGINHSPLQCGLMLCLLPPMTVQQG